nr:tyrosine-type recombinase/integrase [Bifidobacterium catulorum]
MPGVNVCQQIQEYGKPGEVEIPGWLKAEHLYGILWLTTPKTRTAHRFVPITENLWERLWARIRRLGIGPRELVFTNSRGNPIRSSTERYNWRKALAAAGLPMVNVHSARHWTASMTARANMPDDARTAIMGHTSIAMTNHYTHRDAASLAKLLGQAIPELHDATDVIDAEVIDEAS